MKLPQMSRKISNLRSGLLIGAEVPLGENFFLEARYNYGLLDIMDLEKTNNRGSYFNRFLQLGEGFDFEMIQNQLRVILEKTLYIPSQLLTNKMNLMKRTLLPLLLIVISCILGSCSFDGLQYVRDLQETLVYKYEAEEILVKVQNKELNVTLKNSPLEDLSAVEKQ